MSRFCLNEGGSGKQNYLNVGKVINLSDKSYEKFD